MHSVICQTAFGFKCSIFFVFQDVFNQYPIVGHVRFYPFFKIIIKFKFKKGILRGLATEAYRKEIERLGRRESLCHCSGPLSLPNDSQSLLLGPWFETQLRIWGRNVFIPDSIRTSSNELMSVPDVCPLPQTRPEIS